MVYKRGFLAMDTGTQIEGNGGRDHQINYYMDTIAHTCVLIRMEGERFPGFWGYPTVANNGGMDRNHGARSVRVLFNAEGAVGGHIRIAEGSEVLADRPLTREVQP